MSVPLLPSLKQDSKIAIPKSGEWVTDSSTTLGGLVDSLKVAADKHSDISSIPDVWARPILMHSILSDKTHPLYERYVAAWRGILAIMALRKIRNFSSIQLEAVEIPETDRLRDSDPAFLKVLARSVPLEYLQTQNDETIKSKTGIQAKIQILTFGDSQPLAIIWPSILLCPAIGLAENKDRLREVPWWKVDGIDDPINYLSTDEKNSFYSWLQQVIDQTVLDNDMTALLTGFRDEVKESLGADFKDTAFQTKAGTALGITGACQVIDNPIMGVIDSSFLAKSQVLLINQHKDKKDVPDLLIVTTDLDKQWNVSASEIIVGGYINASSCLHRGKGIIRDHYRLGDIDLHDFHAEIHMADEFFTDKIVIFYNVDYNAMPNVLGNRVYDYEQTKINLILPIRQRLLDYLEPEFIAEHTQIEIQGSDIKVTLELPVSGLGGQVRKILAQKTYHAGKEGDTLSDDDEIILYDSLPLIQVWPNISLRQPNAWKTYYTYFDTEGAYGDLSDFHATPLFTEDAVTVQQLPETEAEIAQGKSFPDAFLCEQVNKSMTGDVSREEVGLLILNKNNLQKVSTNNAACKIGIDFGTTNTTAYLQLDGEEPELVHFKNHKYYVTLTEDAKSISGRDSDAVRCHFISEYEQPGADQSSIKTMFHANPAYGNASPFFAGNIYYLDSAQNIDADQSLLPTLKTNDMKWDQVMGVQYMETFLMQFSLQCLVEAVCTGASTFSWMYSYPKAFAGAQKDNYDTIWSTSILDNIRNACTLTSSAPQSLSESESVAEYFKDDMKASPTSGMVCLDIGGGSTDIAVWQGEEDALLNQTSIKFAGQNILNTYLWNRQQNGHNILVKLKDSNELYSNLLEELSNETNKRKFNIKLEALLRDYEKELFKSLPTKRVDPEISLLIRDITFALSGIFFYSGLLIGYLQKNGRYNKQKLLPNFYIGGNASKLLNWTAAGNFTKTSSIGNMFKASFMAGIVSEEPAEKPRPTFTLNMTDRPKQEVAYGLVTADNVSTTTDFDFFTDKDDTLFLAGEQFNVADQPQNEETLTA